MKSKLLLVLILYYCNIIWKVVLSLDVTVKTFLSYFSYCIKEIFPSQDAPEARLLFAFIFRVLFEQINVLQGEYDVALCIYDLFFFLYNFDLFALQIFQNFTNKKCIMYITAKLYYIYDLFSKRVKNIFFLKLIFI